MEAHLWQKKMLCRLRLDGVVKRLTEQKTSLLVFRIGTNDVVGIREHKYLIESIQKDPFNAHLPFRYPKGKVRITVGSRHKHVRPDRK